MTAPVIVRDSEILIPCFRGTRIPFQNLLDYLEAGRRGQSVSRRILTVGFAHA